MSIFQVVAAGQPASGVTCKISSDSADNAYTVLELTLPPGGGAPLHVHRREDEVFHIIDGEWEFQCDGETRSAQTGALIVLPKNSLHSFRNVGSTPARALITAIPGGLDRYFAELGALTSSATQSDVDAINARYEIDFSGTNNR